MATTMATARRVAKFSLVGTIAFTVDISVFNILRLDVFDMGPLAAKVISVLAATTVSWLGSRYWTFKDGKRATPFAEAVGFFAINGIGLLIAMVCLWFSHYLLGLTSALADNISANLIGVGLGNIFRYLMYRRVLFKPRREVIDLGYDALATKSQVK